LVSLVGKTVSHFQIVAGPGKKGKGVIPKILHSWLAVALLIITTVSAGVAFSVPDDNLIGRFRCATRDIPYCKASHSQSPHPGALWEADVLPLD
jgi:hypothetical protein